MERRFILQSSLEFSEKTKKLKKYMQNIINTTRELECEI